MRLSDRCGTFPQIPTGFTLNPSKNRFFVRFAPRFFCVRQLALKKTALRARIPAKTRDDCEIFHSDRHPYNLDLPRGDYSMTEVICKRIMRKIQKLGATKKVATFYSRFFYISMLSVSGIMLTCMRSQKGVKCIGEETSCSLRHTLWVLIASTNWNTGLRIIITGPSAVETVPASSRIHRH